MKLDPKNSFQNAADTSAFVMPSAWFEDFSFGKTMFEALNGNAEALSGVGTGVSDIALQERVKLEAERRKEDGPDASMIAELGAQQREQIAEMQAITTSYSDGIYVIGGVKIEEEDFDESVSNAVENWDDFAQRAGLTGQDKVDAGLLMTAINAADTPEEKDRIMNELGEKYPQVVEQIRDDALEIHAQREATVETAHDANELANTGTTSEIIEAATTGAAEEQRAITWQIEDSSTQQETLSRRGYASTEIDELITRSANTGDELSAMFADVAEGSQFASIDPADVQQPLVGSNFAPMQG